MKRGPTFPRAAAALALLAGLLTALPLLAGAAPAKRHPGGNREQDCEKCHRDGTPELFAAWEGSPHGVALVKCLVCHGSTGADFRPRPEAGLCRGCHAAQVASLAKRPVKDCFACHDPHSLAHDPHR